MWAARSPTGAEPASRALDGNRLGDVDVLQRRSSACRIALGVLVGELAALREQHRRLT